jgi:FkbM family methyltransferase
MKKFVQNLLGNFGYSIHRNSTLHGHDPGTVTRPIGDLNLFLEDIRARGLTPRGIIDVGANGGEWTRMALSVFPRTPVLMIEPQEEMETRLLKFTKENAHCHYIKAGAGAKIGELVQTIWEDFQGSSFLPVENAELLKTGKQRRTPIVTIDKVLSQDYPQFIPDLVKLDIQGFELEALCGAETLFGRTEIFILEASLFQFLPNQPILRDIISFMADRAYELYDIPGHCRRPYDGALGQVDLAFTKAKGMFRRVTDW